MSLLTILIKFVAMILMSKMRRPVDFTNKSQIYRSIYTIKCKNDVKIN